MQLDHGDIGVLYGNLVDNAVEACSKVPEGQRFVKIEISTSRGFASCNNKQQNRKEK